MVLILGGRGQGKLAFAMSEYTLAEGDVMDGATCPLNETPRAAVNHLHLLIRRFMQEGKDPAAWVEEVCKKKPGVLWITDEIGCGIVPADHFERDWREATGRICCMIAQKSERVVRVFCGIPEVLKS